MYDKRGRAAYHVTKGTVRGTFGLLFIPLKIFAIVASLSIFIVILGGALVLTKLVNDNYEKFQEKLRTDSDFANFTIDVANTFGILYNLVMLLLSFAIEIWNYLLPAVSLLVYLFYRIAIAILLTLFQTPATTAMPMGASTPDPESTISGGLSSFLNMLECILIDILTIFSGIFRDLMQALGAMLIVVFQWLDQNMKQNWYRKEYCRMGQTASDTWGPSHTDPTTGQTTYENGYGPGNQCPDNTVIIQGLISFFALIIGIVRDVFIMVFPIIADLLKMIFDALLKILPYILEALVAIIGLFAPDQPLGQVIIFIVQFMVQVLGWILDSCILQLTLSIVTCVFGNIVALTLNNIIAVMDIVCDAIDTLSAGAASCDAPSPISWSSCDISTDGCSSTTSYASRAKEEIDICQIDSCSDLLSTRYKNMHENMRGNSNSYDDLQSYAVDYYKQCLNMYGHTFYGGTETVEGHLFCKTMVDEITYVSPVGVDPTLRGDVLDRGQEICQKLSQSCTCQYESPICESHTCCLTMFSIVVQQILREMEVRSCEDWKTRHLLGRIYCISVTHRSLRANPSDFMATISHCEGFEKLMDQTCKNQSSYDSIELSPLVGGMCDWISKIGFCNIKRQSRDTPVFFDAIREEYASHVEKKTCKRIVGQSLVDDERDMARYELEDRYHLSLWTLAQTHPIVYKFVPTLGKEARLNPTTHLPNGSLRLVRTKFDNRWKDLDSTQSLSLPTLTGKNIPYDHNNFLAQSNDCSVDVTDSSQPSDQHFQCMRESASAASASTQGAQTSNHDVMNAIDFLITEKTNPIANKTINATVFSSPANKYVEIMYNQDIPAPSTWTPESAQIDNTNKNWRVPLMRKNGTNDNGNKKKMSVFSNAC